MKPNTFPPGVTKALGHYVYRLTDPRNGETFFVGRGEGDAIHAHERDAIAFDGKAQNPHLQRIREIKLAGLEVGHVIHRHGLDEATALEVKAALIDAYGGLGRPLIHPVSVDNRGSMQASEAMVRFAKPLESFSHRALLIRVFHMSLGASLFDEVRQPRRINLTKAKTAEVILAIRDDVVLGAFVATRWHRGMTLEFPNSLALKQHAGFEGHPASFDVARQYQGRRVHPDLLPRSEGWSVRYAWE